MYTDDHNPPHFHALYGKEEVVIDIRTCTIIEGRLSPKAMSLVFERTLLHQPELLDNREVLKHESGTLKKILPLR